MNINPNMQQELRAKLNKRTNPQSSAASSTHHPYIILEPREVESNSDTHKIYTVLFEILKKDFFKALSYKDNQASSNSNGYRKRILNMLCRKQIEAITLSENTIHGLTQALDTILEITSQYQTLNTRLEEHRKKPKEYKMPHCLTPINAGNGKGLHDLAKKNDQDEEILNNIRAYVADIPYSKKNKPLENLSLDYDANLETDFDEVNRLFYEENIDTDSSVTSAKKKKINLDTVFQRFLDNLEKLSTALQVNEVDVLIKCLLIGYEQKPRIKTDNTRLQKQCLFRVLINLYPRANQGEASNLFYNAFYLNAQLEAEAPLDVELNDDNLLAIQFYLLQPHKNRPLPSDHNENSAAHKRLRLIYELNQQHAKRSVAQTISLADQLILAEFTKLLPETETSLISAIRQALAHYGERSIDGFFNNSTPSLLVFLKRIIVNANDINEQTIALSKKMDKQISQPPSLSQQKGYPQSSSPVDTADDKKRLGSYLQKLSLSKKNKPSATVDSWRDLLKPNTRTILDPSYANKDGKNLKKAVEFLKPLEDIEAFEQIRNATNIHVIQDLEYVVQRLAHVCAEMESLKTERLRQIHESLVKIIKAKKPITAEKLAEYCDLIYKVVATLSLTPSANEKCKQFFAKDNLKNILQWLEDNKKEFSTKKEIYDYYPVPKGFSQAFVEFANKKSFAKLLKFFTKKKEINKTEESFTFEQMMLHTNNRKK